MNQLQFEPRRSRLRYVVPVILALPIIAVIVFLLVASNSNATISTSNSALATIKLPLGGGTITHVLAYSDKDLGHVPVTVSGNEVWPSKNLKQGEAVTIVATVKRPSWISWVSGTEKIRITETTPKSDPVSTFITRKRGEPLHVRFTSAVSVIGTSKLGGRTGTHRLGAATGDVALAESADAGTVRLAAAPRSWEAPTTHSISWFPAGSGATAVASPAPGKSIKPDTKITLTFSKPVSKVLDGHMPVVTPAGSGRWVQINAHTIEFRPNGYGYGLDARVAVSLPSSVHLIGGAAKWSVPQGSTEQLQALLAELGYLPVTYNGQNYIGESAVKIENQVVSSAGGSFPWRYANTPAPLKKLWSASSYTELTKGAIMMFEFDANLAVDGLPGPTVWKALIAAASKHQKSSFGYTFVFVHEDNSASASDPGETETTWHDGKVVAHGLVNTGATDGAQTQLGTFAVFEHTPVTTMSGTNPDGSTYTDPGIKWVSYFDEGDALHEYFRETYGWPQSNGCVEMPGSEAQSVYPYTPVGTIVQVSNANE
jgi:L,D-transpeptidase catalytic domain